MPGRATTLERAFEIAREGSCATLSDLARMLGREHYLGVEPQLSGRGLRIQLRAIMQRARSERLHPPSEATDD